MAVSRGTDAYGLPVDGVRLIEKTYADPGEDNTANQMRVSDAFEWRDITASGMIVDGPCEVSSVHCLTSSSGKLTLQDGTTSAGGKRFGNGGSNGVAFTAGDTKTVTGYGAAKMLNGLYADVNGTFTGGVWVRPL